MPTAGQKNQVLITGRVAYGRDSSGDLRAITVDANGNIIIGAGSASISKTIETPLLAATAIAASTVVASSVLALTGITQATISISHGRAATTAFGTNGTNYLIQGSEKASGDDTWRTITTFGADSAACSSALSSGAVGAGTSVITILSGTAFAANDQVMWANTADAANSTEWARVVSVSGTASFTILDGITNAQGSTVVITNKAEHFVATIDTRSLTRLRVVVNNNASATTLAIRSKVACITALET